MSEEESKEFAEDMAYRDAALKYMPIRYDQEDGGWAGKSLFEAAEFCSKNGGLSNSNSLCPYKALCPLGVGNPPLGDDVESSLWVPILDDQNNWVQISVHDPCTKWSDTEHLDQPDWNNVEMVDGRGDLTGSLIFCCAYVPKSEAIGKGEVEDEIIVVDGSNNYDEISEIYIDEGKTFTPKTYHREEGWQGQTYKEAISFCAREKGYHICPYDAISPLVRCLVG